MTAVPTIDLNDRHSIPQLGFGVFQIDPDDTAEAVSTALEVGYRHIDTAEMYGNERGVGEAVRASGLDRADVYITSKLDNGAHRPYDAHRAFEGTLSALGVDYVDLFLIHWPLPTLYDGDFVSTWKTLEEFHRDGRARSIGVSNFQVDHLERLAAEAHVVPAVNQIELHPYFLNDEVHAYGQAHGIATQAWSPIAQGAVLDDPAITEISDKLGRSPAQVVLRWHIERGNIVFPKSTTPARIR
jgi:2,5-diketo-D-gluconate reductase A